MRSDLKLFPVNRGGSFDKPAVPPEHAIANFDDSQVRPRLRPNAQVGGDGVVLAALGVLNAKEPLSS